MAQLLLIFRDEMSSYSTPAQSYKIIEALHAPRVRALIACQIQTGGGMTWTNRTFEVVRLTKERWFVDFGGTSEHFHSWSDVRVFLQRLSPRNVEMLELE